MKSLPLKSQNYIGTILAALLCLLSISSANAQLLNFDFSFVGASSIGDPSHTYFTGTVTGEIIGLENNASSTPSDIIITSAPSGLNLTSSLPYSLNANGWNLSEFGTITVTNGAITSATMYNTYSTNQDDEFALNTSISENSPNVGVLNGFLFNTNAVANLGGFSGVTYTLVVPEPSTWAMLLGALGVLAFWRLRTRVAR
jgi:hypothetical protein